MNKARLTFQILVVSTLFVAATSLAHAQLSRTWVSGVGDDVNPCTRTAPCKTFSSTQSRTFINGEIDVLDPGSFGSITITKSLTIDAGGNFAAILASGTTGVTINLTDLSGNDPLKTVRLRGISINGTGASGTVGTRTGVRGINISASNPAAPLVVLENLVIDNFANEGILFNSNGGSLTVSNCSIRRNVTGIRADSAGASNIWMVITNSRIDINGQEGVRVEDNVRATMTNSSTSLNGLNGVTNISSTGASEVNLDGNTIAGNGQNGVFSINGTSTIRVSNNTITNNVANGLSSSGGGLICSNTRNRITLPTQASNCAFTDQ